MICALYGLIGAMLITLALRPTEDAELRPIRVRSNTDR
jgi:hypothetical protein